MLFVRKIESNRAEKSSILDVYDFRDFNRMNIYPIDRVPPMLLNRTQRGN